VIDCGQIQSVWAFAGGGRMVALDTQGQWSRLDEAAHLMAQSLDLECSPESMAHIGHRRLLAKAYAGVLLEMVMSCLTPLPKGSEIGGQSFTLGDLAQALMLTVEPTLTVVPEYLTFSGGVSE